MNAETSDPAAGKTCDVLDLTPIPREMAHRLFAAMAARAGVFEEPDEDLRVSAPPPAG